MADCNNAPGTNTHYDTVPCNFRMAPHGPIYCLFVIALCLASMANSLADTLPVYVGTYTGGDSKGIYLLHFDTESGELTMKGVAAETKNPSFVALHPDGKHLYAVNETDTGEISSFRIDGKTQMLKLINEKPSGGGAPCHLVIDSSGRYLLVANYSGGNVSVNRINKNGALGRQTALVQHEGSSVNQRRQSEPHAHSINLDPTEQFAIAADLGTDELLSYRLDRETGKLIRAASLKLQPGSGPRHFAFHPDGRHAYAINELLSTISVLEYVASAGRLREVQTITTLPRDYGGKSFTAEVRVSHDGRFGYGSNRGHDSVAVFRVGENGRLTMIQVQKIGGKTPRNFTFDPAGKFLLAAGQSTNDIHVFAMDAQTGKLTDTELSINVPTPVCVRFAR